MKLEINNKGTVTTYDISELGEAHSGIINIGRSCKEVWNTIAVENDSIDPFQCSITGAAGYWKLRHGQNRTECPKGLISSRNIPCTNCMGRCVGIHPGRAHFIQRTPETETLVNGQPLGEWGKEITPGDSITIGDLTISIMD